MSENTLVKENIIMTKQLKPLDEFNTEAKIKYLIHHFYRQNFGLSLNSTQCKIKIAD
jgi:hypothetical protein